MAEHCRRLGCFVKVPHHYAGVGIIEKIDHRTMSSGDEYGVILIQARCDDIRDATWISEPLQTVSEYHIVLQLGRVPAEEIGNLGMHIHLGSVAFGVGESDFVALLHE